MALFRLVRAEGGAGAFSEARLWEVQGNVYGLANAPFNFYKVVTDKMITLDFVPHTLDVCLYLFWRQIDKSEQATRDRNIWIIHKDQTYILEAACLWHVDDVLATSSPASSGSRRWLRRGRLFSHPTLT